MGILNDISKKAQEYAGIAVDKAKDLAEVAADKAQTLSDTAKTNMAIMNEQRELEKNYRAIGEWFVAEHQSDVPDAVKDVVAAVNASKERIAQLEASKPQKDEPAVDESEVTFKVCPVCGAASDSKVSTILYGTSPSTPAGPTEPEFPFKDVTTDHPFYEDIKYVYEKGLMQGVSEDIFQSATTTTRGMIATILYRMEGEPAVKNASSFKDVADGMFYSNAVAWAAANGIVNGYADGTFRPDQTISREQMAAILYRYAQYKGCDVSVGEDTNILSYTDVAQVAEYAIPAFQWAVGAGIINGTTASTLSPKGSATRGQVAAILHRYCEWIG